MKKLLQLSFLFILFSCTNTVTDSENKTNNDKKTYSINGYVQKGPFIQGSSITISALDDFLNPTGVNYQVQTSDDFGTFSIGSQITSKYVEVVAKGYYFNEVSGELSSSELSLRAIADLSQITSINVNLLTTLEIKRIKYLISKENKSFVESQKQAQKELLSVFNINETEELSSFSLMDISKTGDSNAILLAISCVVQGNQSVAELSEFISRLSVDFETAGKLSNNTYIEQLRNNAINLDLSSIRNNLNNRYSSLGLSSIIVPEFEQWIDSDGDGLLNKDDFSIFFTKENNADLNTSYTSNETTIVLPESIPNATASVTEGTIVKNGVDTGLKTAQLVNGDKVAIKIMSRNTAASKIESTINISYLDYNVTGKYEVQTKDVTWRLLDTQAPENYESTMVVFDNKIWIISSYAIWYSEDGVTWVRATTTLPFDRIRIQTGLVFNNKLWITGESHESRTNVVWFSEDGITWIEATGNAEWTPEQEYIERRNYPSVVFDNKMWIIGGQGAGSDVWYSEDGFTWIEATGNAQWASRRFHESVVFDNKMWIIGGQGGSPIWYSEDGITWIKPTDDDDWGDFIEHSCVIFDNKIWVVPTYGNDGVWCSEDGITGIKATSTPEWDFLHEVKSVVFDNKIWLFDYEGNTWYSSNYRN